MQRRSVTRVDPRYKQLRTRNNDSVKKSREKARREQDATAESITELEEDNQELVQNLQILKQEYEQLQNLFKQHTGIDIDQVIGSEAKVTSTLPTTSLQPKEIPSKPVLTINTNEDKTSSTSELDATNLDGSVVLINGIQYKIVSMDKT